MTKIKNAYEYTTIIDNGNVCIQSFSHDGVEYTVMVTQSVVDKGDDFDVITIENVPFTTLASLHMLMDDSHLSSRIQVDLYQNIEPILRILTDACFESPLAQRE